MVGIEQPLRSHRLCDLCGLSPRRRSKQGPWGPGFGVAARHGVVVLLSGGRMDELPLQQRGKKAAHQGGGSGEFGTGVSGRSKMGSKCFNR